MCSRAGIGKTQRTCEVMATQAFFRGMKRESARYERSKPRESLESTRSSASRIGECVRINANFGFSAAARWLAPRTFASASVRRTNAVPM